MTVRFSQLVAGRRNGKTTFLANKAVAAAADGKDVVVLLVNNHAVVPFGEACAKLLEERGLKGSYNDYEHRLSVVNSDFCDHCKRGDTIRGYIYFVSRQANIRAVGPDVLLIDNAEFLASDDRSIEEAVLDLAYECYFPEKDLDLVATSTERALELGGTITF